MPGSLPVWGGEARLNGRRCLGRLLAVAPSRAIRGVPTAAAGGDEDDADDARELSLAFAPPSATLDLSTAPLCFTLRDVFLRISSCLEAVLRVSIP